MATNKKDHVAGLAIQVPDEMIQQVIVGEIAKQIGDPAELARQLVERVLTEKDRNQRDYRRQKNTIFENTVRDALQEVAKRTFSEWLRGEEANIREAMLKELNRRKQKHLRKLAELTAGELSKVYVKSISLDFSEE